jgi:hypothetical protein
LLPDTIVAIAIALATLAIALFHAIALFVLVAVALFHAIALFIAVVTVLATIVIALCLPP